MNTPRDSALGREVAYPRRYDPGLLFPIPRAAGRAGLALDPAALPFVGHDRWHAYELSWLDRRGRPRMGTATLLFPCDSPNLVESKSLKLYLNSLNGHRFEDEAAALAAIARDLSTAAGAAVAVQPGLPPVSALADAIELDAIELDIDRYGPPDRGLLRTGEEDADELLVSHLLKSNCPVTGQPDWASVRIGYRGPRLERGALLRYLVSFREHAGFHEQCVERIFRDLHALPGMRALWVEARYTRRGGLDINPWRATPGLAPPPAGRDPRQ